MSVVITDIKYQDDYTGVQSGNGSDAGSVSLMGYPGDFMYAVGNFYVEWNMLNQEMTVTVSASTIELTNTLFSFIDAGFKVGDTIVITGASTNNGSYTISDLTGTTITVDSAFVLNGTFSTVSIYGTTPIHALDFYYNLIGNNDQNTFRSLTDFEGTQRFTGEVTPGYYYYYGTTSVLEPNSTSRAWWNYQVNGVNCKPIIEDLGTDANYRQNYSFIFPFLITPFYKAGELQLLQNAYAQASGTSLNTVDFVPPNYFFEQSLKPIFQIDAKFELTNSEADHSSAPDTTFVNGNTNWYDSFFPSGVKYEGNLLTEAQYEFVSIAYTVNAVSVDEIDFNQTTAVELVIQNINVGHNFTLDPFVLNFMWLPLNPAKVQGYTEDNERNYRTVFLHDRCKTRAGAASANGDMFGTTTQAITGVTSTVAGNVLTINFNIALGILSKSVLTAVESGDRNYMIWIATQGNGVTQLKTSNRTSVICDVNLATTNTDDSTLLEIITNGTSDVKFYRTDSVSAKTDFVDYAGGYGYADCWFKVKSVCKIKNVNVYFEVQSSEPYNSDSDTFIIEQWLNNTEPFWDGKITQILIEEERDFALPEGDTENTRSIKRKASSDTAGYYAYQLIYGFQLKYQFWQSIYEFPEQYLQYHTNYWPIYTQGKAQGGTYLLGDYNTAIKFKIVWDVEDTTTGVTTQFIRYCDVTCYDEAGNYSDFETIIATQDLTGTDLSGAILMNAPTAIYSKFDSKTSQFVIGPTAVGELICYYENGNESVYDRIRTDDTGVETENSVWTAVPTLTFTDYVVGLYGVLDFSQFETKPKTVRLYTKIYY